MECDTERVRTTVGVQTLGTDFEHGRPISEHVGNTCCAEHLHKPSRFQTECATKRLRKTVGVQTPETSFGHIQ